MARGRDGGHPGGVDLSHIARPSGERLAESMLQQHASQAAEEMIARALGAAAEMQAAQADGGRLDFSIVSAWTVNVHPIEECVPPRISIGSDDGTPVYGVVLEMTGKKIILVCGEQNRLDLASTLAPEGVPPRTTEPSEDVG